MICASCTEGASWEDSGNTEVAKGFHSQCVGKGWCDCQHRVGTVNHYAKEPIPLEGGGQLNPETVRALYAAAGLTVNHHAKEKIHESGENAAAISASRSKTVPSDSVF